jgi:hypothetical protein
LPAPEGVPYAPPLTREDTDLGEGWSTGVSPGEPDRRGLRKTFDYFRYAHLGLQFCILVAAGVLGGWWLDGRLGMLPVFTILGTLLGAGAAFYTLYRSVFDRKTG